MMAVGQLKIDTVFVRIVTSFVLGGAALGFGSCVRIGNAGRHSQHHRRFYTRKFLRIGERLEISGNEGMLKAINATHTILQSGEREVSVANAAFLETSATSWVRTES